MGKFLEFLTNAAGPILGIAGGGINNRRQLQQQGQLLSQQAAIDKDMARYNQGLALDMWKKTGPLAQMNQLKEAGLNPGLIYGMGGAGGQTAGSQGGHVSSASAQPQDVVGQVSTALQLGLLKAQKENIEANTTKTTTETKKIGGVDTELAQTQIQKFIADIGSSNAQQKLTELNTEINKVTLYIQDKTKDDQIDTIGWLTEKTMQEADKLWRENVITKAQMNDLIDLTKAELANKWASTYYLRQQTEASKTGQKLTQAQIKTEEQKFAAIIREGYQRWKEIEIQGKNSDTQRNMQLWLQQIKDVPDSERIPLEIWNGIGEIFSGSGRPTPIRGFGGGRNY